MENPPAQAANNPQRLSPRQRILRRFFQLDIEFLTWKPRLMDIMRYEYPEGGRFEQDQQNRGYRHDQWIVNDTALDARKKLTAAMNTGLASEARVWFGLTTANGQPTESQRSYLHDVVMILLDILARSNFYEVQPSTYDSLIAFATSLKFIEDDDVEVVHFTHVPMGQYRFAVDERGRVNYVGRLFAMTVLQIVERFCTDAEGNIDLSRVSQRVKSAWNSGKLDEWVQILHVVEKRQKREWGKRDKKNKPWASCWVEWNQNSGNPETSADASSLEPEGLLWEDGFDEQPFSAPRWSTIGEDAYGRESPGWQCIGDAKGLQALELVGAKAASKIVDPPMNAPDSLKNASLLPGAINYLESDKSIQFTPSVKIPPEAVTVLDAKVQRHEARVQRGHYADLLLIISNDERAGDPTAEEVRAKEKERYLQLGGTFARIAREDFEVVIHRVLAIAQRKGLIPPPPPDMKGHEALNIEFDNELIAAAKTLGLTANDRLVETAGNLAKVGRTDALDKLNVDAILDDTADKLGTNPKLLLSDEQVAQIRQQRAKQQQGAQQGEAMAKAAPAIAKLSDTDPQNLQQLMQQFGENAQAQSGAFPQ